MKIGIITLPLHYNYGGILQAYALQTYLKRMGHEVEHIEVKKDTYLLPIKTRYLVYLKRAFRKYILRHDVLVFRESYLHNTQATVSQFTSEFVKKHIDVRHVKNFADIYERDYDAFVVGSDQIWRSEYICRYGNFAPFLDFTEGWNVKRIAYACSFAKDEWKYTPEATKIVSNLISKFDLVTVREEIAVDLCLQHLNTKAIHVLDPTMLLDYSDYKTLFTTSNITNSPGNLMCYILDFNTKIDAFIKDLSRQKQMKAFMTNAKVEDYSAELKERIQPPVEQWLKNFDDADFVVTDSFHACVFSIIFNKPFICLGNDKRGNSRFDSLLGIINQKYRLLSEPSLISINNRVYEKPEVSLQNRRNEVHQLLSAALE